MILHVDTLVYRLSSHLHTHACLNHRCSQCNFRHWWWVPIVAPMIGAPIAAFTYWFLIEAHHPPPEQSQELHRFKPNSVNAPSNRQSGIVNILVGFQLLLCLIDTITIKYYMLLCSYSSLYINIFLHLLFCHVFSVFSHANI